MSEKIVSIKSNFDRNCAITDKGRAFIWGGE
jgi:hypothetical protein